MSYNYSRRRQTEAKKNIRKAYFFIFLTIASILLVIFLGLPVIAKYAGFLTDIRKSSEPLETTDTTPPPPPYIESLPEATKDSKIEVRGSTEPGATIKLFLNGKEEELIAGSDGGFSHNFVLNKDRNVITALAIDNNGNESQKSVDQIVVYDNEPPELAITKPEDGSQFYGSRQRQVVIEGTTEQDAKVTINGRWVVVGNEGSFTFAATLEEGENKFEVKSSDVADNTTEKTITVNYTP